MPFVNRSTRLEASPQFTEVLANEWFRCGQIEVVEASAPIYFHRKELRTGSGGHGQQIGGLGQTIEFTVDTDRPWQLNAVTSRLAVAPEGIFGGDAGAAGSFTVNGNAVTTQARVTLQPGDEVRLDLPGGGGYGTPEVHSGSMA